MSFHLPVLIAPALLAGVIAFTLAAYVFRRQQTVFDTRGLTVYLISSGLSAVLFALVYIVDKTATMLSLLNIAFAVVILGHLGLFHFSVVFANRRDLLTWPVKTVLAVCSVLSVGLIFTDRFHSTFRSDVELYTGPVRVVSTGYGPSGSAVLLYLLALVCVSAYLIFTHLIRSETLYRVPGLLVATAIGLPVVGSLLNFPDWPHPTVNFIPLSYVASGLLYTLAISRYEFLDVVPLAYQKLVNNVDEYVLVTDPDGTVLTLNDGAKSLVDTPAAVGRPVDALLPVEEAVTSGHDRRQIEISPEDGGETRILDLRSVPIHARDGRLLGRALTLRDITALKERERSLERKNERLEQFASMVSHDLRNPLNLAQVQAELIDDEDAEVVIDSLDRMETMIDSMLDLARAGQDVEETEQRRLTEVVQSAWANLQTGDSELHTDLTTATVESDTTRLLQVFENLFRNALDHNSEPVVVRVGTLDSEGFYVEDDGEGIPDDQRGVVFEHGYTTRENGSGLGLAIVRDIVEAHDWRIRVTESDDGGARFEITTS